MRATWTGARSGLIRIVTGPLEVSRRSVLSRSTSGFWVMGGFSFLFLAGFYDRDHEGAFRNGIAEVLGDSPLSRLRFARRGRNHRIIRTVAGLKIAGFLDGDHERPPRDGAAEFVGDRQRGAVLEHIEGSGLIGSFHLFRDIVGGVGETRIGQKLTVALESKLETKLHPDLRFVVGRQFEAFGQQWTERIDPVDRVFAVKRFRRTDMPLHPQHRNLIERKRKLRRAARAAEDPAGIRRERMVAEYAAEIRRARMMAQHAACGLRRLRRRDRRECERRGADSYEVD